MGSSVVRIEQISIFDYKNVRKGIIDLANSKKIQGGPAGVIWSKWFRKTALIDAIDLLKTVPLWPFCSWINMQMSSMLSLIFLHSAFKLSYKNDDGIYSIWYEFELHRAEAGFFPIWKRS